MIGGQQRILNGFVILINLVFATLITMASSGGSPRVHDILLVWCLINCLWLKPVIFKLFSPLLLIWVLYAPIGIQYGYPDDGMIFSLLNTTVKESKEFFDIKTIVYFVLVFAGMAVIYVMNKKIKAGTKQIKFFRYFGTLITLLFSLNIIYKTVKPLFKEEKSEFKIALSYSEFLNFIPHNYTTYQYAKRKSYGLEKATELSKIKDDWQVLSVNQPYQNYVFVLGESASRHYMSGYGYPVATTPFFDKVSGIKYNNVISAGAYTTVSIPRMLTIPHRDEVVFQNNLLTLANKIGMETFWVSNQEKVGRNDNEIYYIANHAKYSYYLENEPNHQGYDYELLPQIKHIINQPSDKPKFIVVHLMGSHSHAKHRVDKNRPHFNFDHEYLSYYLSSVLQTDLFLQEIYEVLQQNNQPFSMIYTSDHAVDVVSLKHHGKVQASHHVPLFKMSSDDITQSQNHEVITGYGFIWFLTEWLGIDTKNQADNAFLKTYQVANVSEVPIFHGGITSYEELDGFDGKLLLPNSKELAQK